VPVARIAIGQGRSVQGSGSIAPPHAAGYAVGDLLLAQGTIRHPTATASTTATGWSALSYATNTAAFVVGTTAVAQGGCRLWWSWKIATSTSEAVPSFTLAGAATGADFLGAISVWRGTHTTAPITPGSTWMSATGTTQSQNIGPVPGVTIPTDGAALLLGGMTDDSTVAPVVPSGWTSMAPVAGTGTTAVGAGLNSVAGSDALCDMFYRTTAGATGDATWDANPANAAGATGVGVMLVINPPAGAPPVSSSLLLPVTYGRYRTLLVR
jgi:hypothetical protein